jgi:hypothetical protein
MKKVLTTAFVFVFLLLISNSEAFASEGRITMEGKVTCEAISIWQRSRYQVSGRCHGLSYPYAESYDEYVLWATPADGTAVIKLDTVDEGIFAGSVNKKFNNLFITAETSQSPKTPSGIEITKGSVQGFTFKEPTVAQATIIPAAKTAEPKSTINVGNVTQGRKIPTFTIVLGVVLFIVLAVILFRKR